MPVLRWELLAVTHPDTHCHTHTYTNSHDYTDPETNA
jgi:hypothetical protein